MGLFPKEFAIAQGAFLLGAALLTGCATPPAHPLLKSDGDGPSLKELMARRDRIVHLSPTPPQANKPVLLLLHGATDDPTEMMGIVREWRDQYDVYLYSYNYHRRIEKVASDLVSEMAKLRREKSAGGAMTVVVYSYSAIVFRETVILADDPDLFAGDTLIQLVPTAGGSHLARTMEFPVLAWMVSLASKPSAAENPYGRFARHLWSGEGNKKFYEAIRPQRIHTLLVEGDSHSLIGVKNKEVRERFNNGLGPNVVVIPASAGVTHEFLPAHPVALQYLRSILELPGGAALASKARTTVPN